MTRWPSEFNIEKLPSIVLNDQPNYNLSRTILQQFDTRQYYQKLCHVYDVMKTRNKPAIAEF